MEAEDPKPAELLTSLGATNHILRKFGIHYSPRTFAKNRSLSADGPVFVNIGRRIYYRAADLDRWIESRQRAYRSTAERSVAEFRAKALMQSTESKTKSADTLSAREKRAASPVSVLPVAAPARSRDLDIFKLLARQPG